MVAGSSSVMKSSVNFWERAEERRHPVVSSEVRSGTAAANVTFDAASGELHVGDAATVLRPRTAAVMALLAGAPDRLQTKEELLRGAWPDCVVTEESLTQCIKEIRKALGPAAGRVRTIPRRGYVFLAQRAASPASPRRWRMYFLLAVAVLAALAIPAWLLRSPTTAFFRRGTPLQGGGKRPRLAGGRAERHGHR